MVDHPYFRDRYIDKIAGYTLDERIQSAKHPMPIRTLEFVQMDRAIKNAYYSTWDMPEKEYVSRIHSLDFSFSLDFAVSTAKELVDKVAEPMRSKLQRIIDTHTEWNNANTGTQQTVR